MGNPRAHRGHCACRTLPNTNNYQGVAVTFSAEHHDPPHQ